jgi:hypothetical protein
MKRTVALLAAVCLSTVILLATTASAQNSPPTSPPPTQAPPPASDASGDTLKTRGEVSPKTPEAEAAPDSMSAAAKARRGQISAGNPRSYIVSLGLGSAVNYQPDDFKDNYSPSFGGVLAFGVRQYGFTAGVNFNYNFFLRNGTVPNDLNIFTVFAEILYSPFKSKARPYLVLCGGYFRQWVVNLDYTENVLGYGGGAGVELALNRSRRLFLDARYVEGQTRKTQEAANTVIIPIRLGVSWEIR